MTRPNDTETQSPCAFCLTNACKCAPGRRAEGAVSGTGTRSCPCGDCPCGDGCACPSRGLWA